MFYYCFIAVLLLARSSFFLSLLFPCSFLMFLTADSPADPADYAEECSRAALFRRQKTVSANVSAKADAADNAEKDSYHIVECCSCLYNKSVREHACCSLLILCHFLILSSFFLCSFLALSFLARSLFVLCSFLMCLTAVLTEISCKRIQSQVYLSYVECS
jgi:hypothetical protein